MSDEKYKFVLNFEPRYPGLYDPEFKAKEDSQKSQNQKKK